MKKKTYAEQLEAYVFGLAKRDRAYAKDYQRKSVKELFEKLSIYHHRVTKDEHYNVKIMSRYKYRYEFTEDYCRKARQSVRVPYRSGSIYYVFSSVVEAYIVNGVCIPETPIADELVFDRSNGLIWIDSGKGRGELHVLDSKMNVVKVIPWIAIHALTGIEAIDKWSNLKLNRSDGVSSWFKHP